MRNTVLITGATGFVGSRLVSRLVELDYDVHVTIRPSSNLWRLRNLEKRISFHNLDFEDPNQIKLVVQEVKPRILFHLACYGGFVDENKENKILITNTMATYYLLDACCGIGLEKFIYIGSSSEYGNKEQPLSEDDLERPNSIYGVSKLAASNLVRVFAELGRMKTVILRIFSPYGLYDDPRRLIPTVIKACLLKQELQLGSGRQVRDFTYVEDLVDAFILVVKSEFAGNGEILNLGFGKQYSVKEVVDLILAELDYPIQPLLGAVPDRLSEPEIWQAKNERARQLLGWAPKTSLRDGLRETIAWMKNIYCGEDKL